jgi:CRISPR-associated endonuclease/helicase Cas3
MELYPFQERVCELLSAGRSVLLQAPTGSGKTRAAIYPFLRAWQDKADFPRKCIYSVPMRVLANQFWAEYYGHTNQLERLRPLSVTVQTGARPEDPKLEGSLVFTTIDQTLSNFLNIPYALSLSQGNLNAGALLSSYLIFDELHLFEPESSLPTTLHLLRSLRGVVPILAMTATLSETTIRAMAQELEAEALMLSPEEAARIPSQSKTRGIWIVQAELTARAVLEKHLRRSIAVCNTVERSQALFENLCRLAGSDVELRLLHSRFLRADRDHVEAWVQREFGKDKKTYSAKSAILVATQAIEVGLDITSQALHTELAPAASVVQRAGRCARFRKEVGNVYVYRLPTNGQGQPRYAPYISEIEKAVCDRTWQALSQAAHSGGVFDYAAELALVNEAHGPADEQLLEGLCANRFLIGDRIAQTIEAQERGAAPELIRFVDSRSVIVHPDPTSIENPWTYEGFGIFRETLVGVYRKLQELAEALFQKWIFMTADALREEQSSRECTVWRWRPIVDQKDLVGALIVAVNPRLVRYSREVGLRLGVAGDSSWQSPPRQAAKRSRGATSYRKETFQEHVTRMLEICWRSFFDHAEGIERLALVEEIAYAAGHLEHRNGWPKGTFERLIRLVLALHDLGKLDTHWQEWAHGWQTEVSVIRGASLDIPDGYLAAHTDYDEQNEAERRLNQRLARAKPNHAAESAATALDWLLDQVHDVVLARAALTAIVRHHSAGAKGRHGRFRAHPAAAATLTQVLDQVGEKDLDTLGIHWNLEAGGILEHRLVRPRREQELLSYLLLARVLRLADQRSQDLT